MNNKEYTKLYNLILNSINDFHLSDSNSFFNLVENNKIDVSTFNNKFIYEDIINIFENLIIDKMIKGEKIDFIDGPFFRISGLTTKAYNYLATISQPKALVKIKQALHDEGIPITPTSISRFAGKLFF